MILSLAPENLTSRGWTLIADRCLAVSGVMFQQLLVPPATERNGNLSRYNLIMNSMKLVSPFHFISWKKTPNDAVAPQFTPNMKANVVPCLLSSLVWIDQYNECCGITSFMEFMPECFGDKTSHVWVSHVAPCNLVIGKASLEVSELL